MRVFGRGPDEAATDEDRTKWTGFSDLESEPAIFNSILSRWGVEGVKTCEVTCMDSDTLRSLPQPVYGIIFLYRYTDIDEDHSSDEEPAADANVWFATQNMNNMCGSLALLNMVMNIPNLELGSLLERFKKDTLSMAPTDRGDSVADFAFLRRIHNSWAKKTDMLNQDLKLQQDFKKAKRRKSGGTKRKKKKDEGEDEMAYHFIAYVPIGGRIWKLDGMEQQAEQLEQGGRGDGDWIDQISSLLSDRMALLIGEDISFNVLAMTKDPLLIVREELAVNINSLYTTDGALDWRRVPKEPQLGTPQAGSQILLGPSETFSISRDFLQKAGMPDCFKDQSQSTAPDGLLASRKSLISSQVSLRNAYREEEKAQHAERSRAEARRREYGPLVAKWVRYLAQADDPKTAKSMLDTLIQRV